MRRLRVLIAAHEFSSDQGSECAVGWNIATRLAAFHDVTVLCADGPPRGPGAYRTAVSEYFEEHGTIPGLAVVFVEQPPLSVMYGRINGKLLALTHGAGMQPLWFMGLNGWHHEAFRAARALGWENFDVVHQLTPVNFLRPGYLWRSNVPFFWGPIAGMYMVPGSFSRSTGLKSYLFQTLRSLVIAGEVRTPRFKRVVQRAERIWTVTGDERRTVDSIASGTAVAMIESAPPPGIAGHVRQYDGKRPLSIFWAGRHDAPKALPLLLHAIAHLPQPERVALNVTGEGPQTKRWQALAEELSLTNVTWLGHLPSRDEAWRAMGQADVFVHSSIKEGTPMVVLEAMASGLPVICHDVCGMAVAVDAGCGIKVPCENPARSARGFRDAIEGLLRDPASVEKLSEGALRRASELSWDAKVKEIAKAYVRCVEQDESLPTPNGEALRRTRSTA